MSRLTVLVVLLLALCVAPAELPAQPAATGRNTVTIGLFTPSAPFSGPEERLEFISKLAAHLEAAAGGVSVTGRVYSREEDLDKAIKRGEIQFAVVDVPYVAALGMPYPVLGAALRGGATASAWEVVASKDVRTLFDLKGESIIMPRAGARDTAFLTEVLFEGEVKLDWFGRISYAPDPLSAMVSVGVGRARAAVVPAGLTLPAGVKRGIRLREVGWPVLVRLPSAQPALQQKFAAALDGFHVQAGFEGFAAAPAGNYQELVRAFAHPEHRGPMVMAAQRVDARALLEGRQWRVPRPDLTGLVTVPRLR